MSTTGKLEPGPPVLGFADEHVWGEITLRVLDGGPDDFVSAKGPIRRSTWNKIMEIIADEVESGGNERNPPRVLPEALKAVGVRVYDWNHQPAPKRLAAAELLRLSSEVGYPAHPTCT